MEVIRISPYETAGSLVGYVENKQRVAVAKMTRVLDR